MKPVKPSNARGTRDFTPTVLRRRQYIFRTLSQVFEKYGYAPIETPAMENLSVLSGKYGEEGDRLMFRILNSGDYLKEAPAEARNEYLALMPHITEKALRYDLTVPFARFVVMHQNELAFPFKRYQIQPVWRADRPQRGRYREFTQCDVDVVGSKSLLHEAEFVAIYDEALSHLGLKQFAIHVNHRQVLAGIAEVIGAQGKEVDLCTAIDKLDKIGRDGVEAELRERGIGEGSVQKLAPIYSLTGTAAEQIAQLKVWLKDSETGMAGIADFETLLGHLQHFELKRAELKLDLTLARGLNYYTGCIFEVKSGEVQMGSIGGGGRYDNLTAMFGGRDLPGAGISFGADRIYDVMEELNLFEGKVPADTTVALMVNFGAAELGYALKVVQLLRSEGLAVELYPDATKMGKQLEYADKRGIPFALIAGGTEQAAGTVNLKNLQTGTQEAIALPELAAKLRALTQN